MDNLTIRNAAKLVKEAIEILQDNKESNWQSSLRLIEKYLFDVPPRFEEARSLYKSMVANGRGFSEFNIWNNNYDMRVEKNLRIDCIRQELWSIFE